MRRLSLPVLLLTACAVAVPAVQLVPAIARATEVGSVSAQAASSWQSNATVWKMAYGHGDIWMIGDFTSLRPPGDALGTGEQPANYFAALNASTGAPDPAVDDTHTFTGQTSGLPLTNGIVAVSPDGKTVYVGGRFTTVDGVARNHIAAFSATTGALLPWAPNVSGPVSGIATYGNVVYISGAFGKVNKVARTNLAAVSATDGSLLTWGPGTQPYTNNTVDALAVSGNGSQVIAGGYFNQADGVTQSPDGTTPYNKAIIIGGIGSATPGALEPFPADSIVPVGTDQVNDGCVSDVKDIVVAGGDVYLADEGTGGGCFDGTWAAHLADGTLKWENQCLGATQTIEVVGDYLYKGSHAHDCESENTNGDPANFPQVPENQARHLLSESISNGFLGPWYPFSNAGPNLGPRAMATDGSQLYVGGDFTTMNHVGQQGIARFTPAGDYPTPTPVTPVAVSAGPGRINVFAQAPVDLDDPDLTMELFRDAGATPIATTQVVSLFWKQAVVGWTDTGIASGSQHTYRVEAVETDGAGSSPLSGASAKVTASLPTGSYTSTVLSQSPSAYWRFDEPSGTLAADTSHGLLGGAYHGTVTLKQSGAIVGDTDTAATFDGSTGYFSSGSEVPSPTTFSVEAWFKTTTTSGGKIVGFGDQQTGDSNNYDKQIYMTNTGHLDFGTYNGEDDIAASPKTYNDGAWHQVVATQGPLGMSLFVDGVKVAGNPATTNQSFDGYWRVGGDNLNDWPDQPTSEYFGGTIDDVSVYPSALTPQQISAQYAAAGYPVSSPATASAPYARNVLSNGPSLYWRLDEATGTSAADLSGNLDNGRYGTGDTLGASGAISDGTTPPDPAVTTNGGDSAVMVSTNRTASLPAFSLEAWFATSHSGGKIIGFGDSASATGSQDNDKELYFSADGSLNFGVYNNEKDVISAPPSLHLTDGAWHHVVAVQGASGMALYVDGSLVASNSVSTNQSYSGYWHVAGDTSWSNNGNDFSGSLDEVAVYPYALSAAQVSSDYLIGTGQQAGPSAPVAPQNVTASSTSSSSIDLTWSDVPGASTYQVQRSIAGAGSFSNDGGPLSTTSLHDTGLTAGESYDYRVVAINAIGSSVASAIATATVIPGSLGPVTATAASASEIDLNWDPAPGATSYDVRRGAVGSGSFPTDLGAVSGTSFADTSLSAGSSFDYEVVATNAGGEGGSSVVTASSLPAQVTGLTAAAASSTEVDLSWDQAVGAATYRVQRSPAGADTWSVLSTGSATSFADTGVVAGTGYDYRVAAVGAGGVGANSATVSLTTPGAPALLLSNGFEGGTLGGSITAANSGGPSGSKFTAVSCKGGSITYGSTAAHGALGAALAPSKSPCYLQWAGSSVPAGTTKSYGRFALKLPADPGSLVVLAKLGSPTFGRDAQIDLTSGGKLALYDATNAKVGKFTHPLPLHTWVRVEWSLVNSPSSGSLRVRVYSGDSTTPIENQLASGINTGSSFGALQLGSVITTSVAPPTFFLDDAAITTAGPLGPAS